MLLSVPLQTPRLLLRTLRPSDVGARYLSWLADTEITRFLEVRFTPVHNIRELVAFVESLNASDHSLLLGMFAKKDERHIGNIKLGPVNPYHHRADIAFLLGEQDYWGQGYASEAIAAFSQYGLHELGLEKITAGCYATNIGSAKALMKAGFVQEATIPSHVVCDGVRDASWLFGLDKTKPK